ncbi:MAG: hemolysin family protein [Chloroflexota bacterium]|nr:hemolysin family protein [Chloroflexota bacterium]
MDTDNVPLAIILTVSLPLFSFFSLAQHSIDAPGGTFRNRASIQKAGFVLRWCRYACVIAVALSVLVLANIQAGGWLPGSVFALAILFVLLAVDWAASFVVLKNSSQAEALCRPLTSILFDRRPLASVGNGHSSNGVDGAGDVQSEEFSENQEPVITEEELVSLDHRDREMLRSILKLDVTTAREIMVPRLDMVAVGIDSSLIFVAEQMVQGGHSRIPVFEESIDHILGIVHSREVLAAMASPDSNQNLRDLLNPAFFIPETKRLDDLLEELKDKGIQMAIVVDEYGGTEGVLTMEDLLEEIVGEIEDEFSRTRESELVHLSDGGVLVDAGVPTEDIEDLFSTTIDSEVVDTVGGYVYQMLGKIPSPGDVVNTDHLRIEVVSILGRRLRKLRINRIGVDASTPAD